MPKVLFYVQHLLGVGHVKRAAALARAMVEKGLEVSVVLGGPDVPHADFGLATVLKIPTARTADSGFQTLLDEYGKPIDNSWRDARRERLLGIYDTIAPDLLLIELYPFGRRQFRFELRPLLDRAKGRGKIMCSVRDVLVRKNNLERNREIVDIIQDNFDTVLVHGLADVIPFTDTFPESKAFEDRIKYTGYVTDPPPSFGVSDAGRGEVIVSIGGGAVGESLMRTALKARTLSSLSTRPWRLLAGDNLEESIFQSLKSDAPRSVIVERARADFRQLLQNAELSISQGGYNTVMDILAAGCRAVIVPFAEGGESEQTYRAQKFADMGLLHLIEASELSPATLANGVDEAMASRKPDQHMINLNGAETTADFIGDMLMRDQCQRIPK